MQFCNDIAEGRSINMNIAETDSQKTTATPPLSTADAETWFKVRKHIRELNEAITENYLTQLDHVARLSDESFPYTAQLLSDCNVSPLDIETYLKFRSTLRDKRKLLKKKCVSPEVIRKLINAPENVRQAAFRQIQNRAEFSIEDFESINVSLTDDPKSRDTRFIESGIASLRNAAALQAAKIEADLRDSAAKLFEMMVSHAKEPGDNSGTKISEHASRVLQSFTALFGSDFPPVKEWLKAGLDNPERRLLAQSYYALKQIADGQTTIFPEFSSRYTTWSSFDAVRYLAGIFESTDTETWRKPPAQLQRLTAVQLGADCGGLTLGLEAARFDVRAVAELDWKSAEALVENRPSSVVEAISVGNVLGITKLALREVGASQLDLLAGNLLYSGMKVAERHHLWNVAIEYVASVRPRAFFFRIDATTYGAKANITNRQKHKAVLQGCGYNFQVLTVSARDVGLPQGERTDSFIVGIQQAIWDSTAMPVMPFREPPSVYDVVKGHAFPNHSDFGAPETDLRDPNDADRKKQETYDRWVKRCIENLKTTVGPDVSEFENEDPKQWVDAVLIATEN